MSRLHDKLDRRKWAKVRKAVLNRDGWRCRMCGKAGRLEVDHVIPLEKGGAEYDPANLRALCRGCHILKTYQDRPDPVPGKVDWIEYVRQF